MSTRKPKNKYQFHRWWVPSSDKFQNHLYPEWAAESPNDNVAVCGLKMGGAANGGRAPYCKACIAGAAKAEDMAYLRLCKKYRGTIVSIIKTIDKLQQQAENLPAILFRKDGEELV